MITTTGPERLLELSDSPVRPDGDQRKAGKLRESISRQLSQGAGLEQVQAKLERLVRITEGAWRVDSPTEELLRTLTKEQRRKVFAKASNQPHEIQCLATADALMEELEHAYPRDHYVFLGLDSVNPPAAPAAV